VEDDQKAHVQVIGMAMGGYEKAVKQAFEYAGLLKALGFDQPWVHIPASITAERSIEPCRIRLEIR
jgi:hypothetical protein